VVGIFERQFMDGDALTITGDGEQRRDFTHIDDIVDALVRCVGKEYRAEEFEFGRGVNYSINEIAEMFNSDTTYIPARPGEYPTTLADYSNAKEKLGWTPTKNIKDYITNWVKEYKNV
jgi:UDP-glucose 4-epimerase